MPIAERFSQKSVASFLEMFKQEDVEIFIVISPQRYMDAIANALKQLTTDSRYVVLAQEELLVDTLQVEKFLTLSISDYIHTEYYVELQEDMIFTKPFSSYDLLNAKRDSYPFVLHTKTMQKRLQDLKNQRESYKGYYINLKKDRVRNDHMKKHLQDLGFSNYTRFEALDGKVLTQKFKTNLDTGSLGCGFSHKSILELNADSDKHLHITEDDALLYKHLPNIFNTINTKVDWDIIYTDIYFSMLSPISFFQLHEKYKLYKEKGDISIVNLKGIEFSGATSYFVNKNSINKFNDFLDSDWYKHAKHDTYINTLVQKGMLKAFVIVPFISTLSHHSIQSTIDESYNSNMLALDTLRKSFYIEAKHKALSTTLKKSMENIAFSDMVEIYTDATKVSQHNLDKKLHVEII